MLTTSHLRRVDAVVSGGTAVNNMQTESYFSKEVVLNITFPVVVSSSIVSGYHRMT